MLEHSAKLGSYQLSQQHVNCELFAPIGYYIEPELTTFMRRVSRRHGSVTGGVFVHSDRLCELPAERVVVCCSMDAPRVRMTAPRVRVACLRSEICLVGFLAPHGSHGGGTPIPGLRCPVTQRCRPHAVEHGSAR